jgi:hypothetical protein
MTGEQALAFVRKHGVELAAAIPAKDKGPSFP